jgi:hypothetical protein
MKNNEELIYMYMFSDYVYGKHITEIGAVGGYDVNMIDDMVAIMKRQNLLIDGDCLRLGTDLGRGNTNLLFSLYSYLNFW